MILATLTGETTVAQACAALGVGEARFHQLRQRALEGALAGLAARSVGRPRKASPSPPGKLEALEHENEQLRLQLQTAEIREEIALVMPHLLRSGKKTGQWSRRRKRSRKTP
jgi:transposase-like protein